MSLLRRVTLGLGFVAGACNLVNGLDGYEFSDPPPATGSGGAGGQAGLFAVSVEVVGLSTEIALDLNGVETLPADADGSYTFETRLAIGASWAITFADPPGERCQSDTASGTVADADVAVTVSCKPTVRPRYPDAPDWLDYLDAAGDAACNAGTAARYDDCIHGGERRAVYVPRATDCEGVDGSDALGAFAWTCDDSGPYVELVSTRLVITRGLTHLIDFAAQAFAPNAVTITTPSGSVTTDPEVWWGNTIAVADGSGALDGPGTIHLVLADPGQALTLGADRVALVVDPDVQVSAAAPALVASGVDFVWVEGAFDGGLGLDQTGLAVLRNLRVTGQVALSQNRALLGHGLAISEGAICLDAADNVGLEVQYAAFHTCVRPAQLVGGTGGYLREAIAANCPTAILIDQSTGFAVDHVIASSLGLAGLTVQASSDVHLARIVAAAGEQDGVRLDCTECSLRGATAVLVKDQGFHLAGTGVWASELLAVDDAVGIQAEGLTAQGRNWIAVSNRHAVEAFDLRVLQSALVLGGVLKLGGSDTPCFVSASTGLDALCNPADGSTFVLSPANGNTLFAGKVTQDDVANASDVAGAAPYAPDLQWVGFDEPTRGWGVDGSAFPNLDDQGRCSAMAGTCRIWDWALRANNAVAKNQNATPTGNDVATVAGQTFLLAALELFADGAGDDDTLCESNERCLVMANVGAYQGHGALDPVPFQDGLVTGVTLFIPTQNGR